MECSSCGFQSLVTAFVDADLERSMGRCQSKKIKEAIAKLREAMQNVCLTCVDEVNDNNPSNHGQTFYSLDSGHCQTTSGRSASTHSDNNEVISRADWITSHAHYDSAYHQDNTYRPYSGSSPLDSAFAAMRRARGHVGHSERVSRGENNVTYEMVDEYNNESFFDPSADDNNKNPFQDEFSITTLPSSVESILLREMNNFAALPPLHKMLICCLLAGINISDFARMGWLPKEIKKMMKPQTKDMEIISAQTAHAIYQNICKKLPYLTVLARATKKRSKERIVSQNAAIREYQKANSKMVAYLQSPKAMATIGKPKENPHKKEEPVELKKGRKNAAKKSSQGASSNKYQQREMF